MILCYIDESGTSSIPGNTSHFVLAGISIPVERWRECDAEVNHIKNKYALGNAEIHVAWMMRNYIEQTKIQNFAAMNHAQRRAMVDSQRVAELHRLNKVKIKHQYRQTKKNYKQTESYTHLTLKERKECIREIAECIANWRHARLFAECIDKVHFATQIGTKTVDEQAFEQIVSRLEQYLQNIGQPDSSPRYGLLIHDNNQTVAKRHTELMKRFHESGTLWINIQSIIETPLFVDSQLTSMVQIADLCSYSLRRYLENGEKDLFKLVFKRADRVGNTAVGVRHFTKMNCKCQICTSHRRQK